LGGVLIRTYAGHFPDEVKALAYIDPTDFTPNVNTINNVFRIALELQVELDSLTIKKYLDEVSDFILKSIQGYPPGYKAEMEFIMSTGNSNFENVDMGITPKIPIVVFLGTKYTEPLSPPGFEDPFKKAGKLMEAFNLSQKQRIESNIKWIYESPEGYFFISPKASHAFHLDEPQLVIEMIKRLLG
jgi:pimeloyl-ACP methyl ester carboxylesterase